MEGANSSNFSMGIPVNQGSQMNKPMSPLAQSPPSQQQYYGTLVNHQQQPLTPQQQIHQQQQQKQQFQKQQQQQQQQQLLQQQKLTPQQQMQQQKLIQQKKQQQAMLNYENQFHQLLSTINKKPKRLYNFVEDTNSILQKYKQYKPSFEFHIFENSYKICAPANTRLQQQQKSPELNSDGLILNKNNEMLKEFLEYVARNRIPEAIMEVLKDCNIQFYEGNLILQVYDHTNTVDIKTKENKLNVNPPTTSKLPNTNTNTNSNTNINSNVNENNSQQKSAPISSNGVKSPASDIQNVDNNRTVNSSNGTTTNNQKIDNTTTIKRPRVYRTLLRPNDLTTYYDMMSYADHSRFSDSVYQLLESELLSITKRNVLLDVPLNPYQHIDYLEASEFMKPVKSKDGKVKYPHRELSTIPGSLAVVGHIEQHEELPQHSSNYEQMMLIAGDRTTTTTLSTLAIALTKQAMSSSNQKSSQKSTSSVEEDYADKKLSLLNDDGTGNDRNKEKIAAAAAVNVNGHNDRNQFNRIKFIEQWKINKKKMAENSIGNNGKQNNFDIKISMRSESSTNIQNLNDQQTYKKTTKQAQTKQQKGKVGTKRAANVAHGDKPKVKKPRKNAKKSNSEPAEKKKRVPKKKQQNDHATNNAKTTKATNKSNSATSKTK